MNLEECIEALNKLAKENPYEALGERYANKLIVSMDQLKEAKAIMSSSIGLNKEIYEQDFPNPEEETK